ncbi:MAG: ATP-binding cassette domain-containing protein [Actinomycetota bacterium]
MTTDGDSLDGLSLRGVTKRFGDVLAVDGVDLDVPTGSIVGFLGPNGAGKTTTMRSIVGMARLDAGAVTWRGQPVDDEARRRIGYMPQERGLYARMKVVEQVEFFGRLAGLGKRAASERARHWIEALGLSDRAESLVQELSGGNQQRVQLAVALVHDPDLLVLDEPFAGLDPVAADVMRELIRGRADAGAAVLFSSHQLDLVEGLCDRVVIVADGRVRAAGDTADLRAASPIRRLDVAWATEPVGWSPPPGVVRRHDASRTIVDVPREVPVAEALATLAAGTARSVSYEPPGLDEVFADLITSRATAASDRATA